MISIKKYLELVRFSHTVFAMPFALASLVLASSGWPSFRTFVLVVAAVIFCRNTAMAFNRWVDAEFDKENPRTSKRHLPAGLLSPNQVIGFIGINALLFVAVAYLLNTLAFALSIPTLLVVCFYSLTKRFSNFPHLFLGLALGISPIGAWVAVRGSIHPASLFLGLALLLWVTGFDIIYATQDEEVDKKLGLHSLVTFLGVPRALWVAKALHLALVGVLLLIEWQWHLGFFYQVSVVISFILLIYIHYFKKSSSLDAMNKDFFLANAAISLFIFFGVSLSALSMNPIP